MRRFGLLGKTLGHSFSQGYFTQKFADLQLTDHLYQNFELASVHHLPALLQQHPDLVGLNVTIPYKEAVLPFLHQLSTEVEAIGACNCICMREGKLWGYNTDVVGFAQTLTLQPHHQKALILGSGGASKAVQYVLTQKGVAWQVVSTSGKGALHYEDLGPGIIETHLLIVNTTPLGTFPEVDTAPLLPYHLLSPKHLLYDLVYNPPETLFLKKGKAQGATTVNGYAMLVGQAEESWRIWNQP